MTDSDSRRSRRLRPWHWWLLAALLVVAVVYGRALWESRAELRRGQALLDGSPEDAIIALRHAVEWYAPGNPFSRQAADELLEIGLDTSPERAPALALRALDALRSGILVTRSLYTPYGEHLELAEARIAELRGAEAASRSGEPLRTAIERHATLLSDSRERAPAAGWSLMTVIGFGLWLGVTGYGVATAFDARTRRRRRFALVGAAFAVTLATWVIGLCLV